MTRSSSSIYQKKARNSKRKQKNPRVFISAEGKNKTEVLYFKSFFRDRNIRMIKETSSYTDPVQLLDALKKRMDDDDFDAELGDKAFCLIDADFDKNKDQVIRKAEKKAVKYGIKLIVSAPCFEVWYICHYECSTAKFTSNNEVFNKLRSYFNSYSKSKEDMYQNLKDKTEKAIQNAKKLEQECHSLNCIPHTVDFSPSTEVYKIVERFVD